MDASAGELTGPIEGGTRGRPFELSTLDLATLGYREREYFLSGKALSYGTGSSASYTTRLLVRAPADPARFTGTVVVEWLNVATASDVGMLWIYGHTGLTRSGAAWVGVSAQARGVTGAPSLTGGSAPGQRGLLRMDPERYGALRHPGDEYCYDMFTAAGVAAREHCATLVGGACRVLLAAGFSESATRLTTYVNGVDPMVGVFDGFLLDGRHHTAPPLRGGGAEEDRGPTTFRDALRVPVLVTQTETDVLYGSSRARQRDTPLLRTWEVAGASHADTYLEFGAHGDTGRCGPAELAAVFSPAGRRSGINSAPQHHYVTNAALYQLDRWVRGADVPPRAEVLALTDGGDDVRRDEHGNALGGLRTPWVDAPLAEMVGVGPSRNPMTRFFGRSAPLPAAVLDRLYRDEAGYVEAFTDSATAAAREGFLHADDLAEVISFAPDAYRLVRGDAGGR